MKNINGELFNREKIFLAAMQEPPYLEMVYETSSDGLETSDALSRLADFGNNEIRLPRWQWNSRMGSVRHRLTEENLHGMYGRKVAVLRKGLVPYIELPATSLVPGDVVFLIAGEVVPADIRIIGSDGLMVDQHIFDGCRIPVPKSSSSGKEVDFSVSSVLSLPDIAFAGTVVVQGKAKGLVISTGPATYLGKCLLDY